MMKRSTWAFAAHKAIFFKSIVNNIIDLDVAGPLLI